MNCKLAMTAAANAALDPILSGIVLPAILQQIINTLFPQLGSLVTSCLNPAPTPAAIQQTLINGWTGTAYVPSIMNHVRLETRIAGDHVGQRLTRQQAEAIGTHTLNATRLGNTADVQEMLTACCAA
jgi:hypothetical protein